MAKLQIADPARSLAPYYEQPMSRDAGARRGRPGAHLDYLSKEYGGGPIPVARPSGELQMTPIVQPVAFVPYSTQKQAIFTHYDDEQEDDYENEFDEEVENQKAEEYAYGHQETPKALPSKPAGKFAPAKKKAVGASVALFIFSILSAAVLIAGKFLASVEAVADYLKYLDFTSGNSAYAIVETFIKEVIASGDIKANLLTVDVIAPAAIALGAIFLVVTFIGSIVGFGKKHTTVAAKVGTIFTFIFSVATLVYTLAVDGWKFDGIGIGMYIFVGLSFVMMLIALIEKKSPYRRK